MNAERERRFMLRLWERTRPMKTATFQDMLNGFPPEQINDVADDNHKICLDFMELEYNGLVLTPEGAVRVRNRKGSTPLIRACYYGYVDIVVKLLDEYHVDIEEMGSISITDQDRFIANMFQKKIELEPPKLVRPLYAAAFTHNVGVLKELIKGKASINGTCSSGETALHGACLKGKMDAVKILISNGADVNIVDDNDLTCIMHAAKGGSVDVTKYLARKGQNINQKNKHGYSALDYYAMHNASGAKYFISYSNAESLYSAVIMAAANKNSKFVKSCRKRCSVKQEVDAFLLLGCSYLDFSARFTVFKKDYVGCCIKKYKLAMDFKRKNMTKYEKCLKHEESERFTALPTREIETLGDVNDLDDDFFLVVKQCLLIQGRILGPSNPKFCNTYCTMCDFLTSVERLHVNIYALLKLQNNFEADYQLYKVYFSSMVETLSTVSFDVASTYLNELFTIFSNTVSGLDNFLQQSEQNEDIKENFEKAILKLLLFIKFFITSREGIAIESFAKVKTLVEQFVKWKPICCNGRSPLHYIFQKNSYNSDLFKFLLKRGADINAVDNDKNTPLHVLANKPSSKIPVELLLKSGAHIDARNANQETPLQLMSNKTLSSFDKFNYIKLKCLCSRVLKDNGAPHLGRLPIALQTFVNFH